MHILYMTLRLRAPWCHSLKEKRAALRPVIEGLKRHFNASVSESGLQDSHQQMEISLAVLVHHSAQGDSIREQILETVGRLSEAELYEETAEYR